MSTSSSIHVSLWSDLPDPGFLVEGGLRAGGPESRSRSGGQGSYGWEECPCHRKQHMEGEARWRAWGGSQGRGFGSASFSGGGGPWGQRGNSLLFGKALLEPMSEPCRQLWLQPSLALGTGGQPKIPANPAPFPWSRMGTGGLQGLRDHRWAPKCLSWEARPVSGTWWPVTKWSRLNPPPDL